MVWRTIGWGVWGVGVRMGRGEWGGENMVVRGRMSCHRVSATVAVVLRLEEEEVVVVTAAPVTVREGVHVFRYLPLSISCDRTGRVGA